MKTVKNVFLFEMAWMNEWWQTLSSPRKHLDYAAPCILSYLEFIFLIDSIVTKDLLAFALKTA